MQRYPVKQYSNEQHADINMLVYIADICNYNCEYCYNKKPRTNQLLDLNKLNTFLIDMQKKTNKIIAVELIGGEPTLHPNLLSFLEKTKNIPNIQFAILTNFHKDLQYYLNLIDQYKLRIIPTWHSIPNDLENKDFENKIFSIPEKYFDYVADGKHYHNFFIRLMFEKNNFNIAKELYLKIAKKYPQYLESSLVADPDTLEAKTLNDVKVDEKYVYTQQQLLEYYKLSDLIKEYKQLYTVEYNDGFIEHLSYNDMFLNDDFTFHMWKCNAGKDYLYIHVNGDIYPCQSYYEGNKKKLYNMLDTPFYDISKMKAVICQCKTCSCDFEIYKEKIFKNMQWKTKYQF